MRPGEALMELARYGFRFRLDGEVVKVRFEGGQALDPAVVSSLLDLLRQHKDDVRIFLKCYCPKCGGCATCPDYEGHPLCLNCDWSALLKLYPAMAAVAH